MLDQLKLMILDYINLKNLNYKIIRNEDDLFMVDVFYGDESTFKYTFILNKSTPRWNNCGFIGINDDEYRPMTKDGMNELFEISNLCIDYGFCLSILRDDKVMQTYQAIDESKESNNKTQIINFINQNRGLFVDNFDAIRYQSFKKDCSYDIQKEELEKS